VTAGRRNSYYFSEFARSEMLANHAMVQKEDASAQCAQAGVGAPGGVAVPQVEGDAKRAHNYVAFRADDVILIRLCAFD
jgi:hypothetical protein